jgi:hypothetical protein
MLKQLADLVTSLLFLARDTRENKEAIVQVRQELDQLADAVEKLTLELRHLSERERLEREKTVLQLENALLRLDKALPPSPRRRSTKS